MKRSVIAMLATVAVALSGLVTLDAATAETSHVGSTYRVDCSSRINGDGTSLPWNSPASVNAHGAFAPGDRILFKRGTHCWGRLTPTGSGTAEAPILLGAYGTGRRPLLSGGGTPDRTATVTLRDVAYWTVQDLRISNHGKSLRTTLAYRSALAVINTGLGRLLRGIVIQRLYIAKVTSAITMRAGEDSRNWGGISVVTYRGFSAAPEGFANLLIRDNVIDHVGRTGIVVTNRSWPKSADVKPRITGNTVSWARSDSIILRGSTAGRIDHNLSAHGADMWPCPECSAVQDSWHSSSGIWTALSRGVRIDHNEVYGMRKLGGDGEAFDADRDAMDTVIEYNYAHGNEGGAMFFCGSSGAVVRFNIFQNNGRADIAFIGNYPATNSRFYNNTIYHSKGSAAGIVRFFNGKSGQGFKFYNNLVYSFGRGTYHWPMSVVSRANTYVGTHRSGEPRGKGYSLTDPRLRLPGHGRVGISSLGGYRPTTRSVTRSGVPIPTTVLKDFFGRRISPSKPPRGAAA